MIKKKPAKIAKTKKKEPTPAALLKKVAAVSDSTKTLSKEIKLMLRIFSENQKVLVSMNSMINSLTLALEQIQKQSKQINILEEDAKKLFSGLNQVRSHSNLITKINDQTARLQEQIHKIEKSSPEAQKLSQKVSESIDANKNNSQTIIKIAQRIDEVRDDLRKVSTKVETISSVSFEVDQLSKKTESFSEITSEIENIQKQIQAIVSKAEKIEPLGGAIDELKQQFQTVSSKAESITSMSGKLQNIESEINSLVKRADSTAFVGESLKSVQSDFSSFKENMLNKTNTIEQKISSLSDLLKRADAASAEFHKKTDKVFQELQGIKSLTNKASSDSSKEMMALLKLSEYQSKIRMNAETKYGDIKILEDMTSQTAQIINLFDKISIETQEKIPLPPEVRRWAVGKILDCADKWEVRFSDVFNILVNNLGRDLLKKTITVKQVRDIYGIRAVDEIRKELKIS